MGNDPSPRYAAYIGRSYTQRELLGIAIWINDQTGEVFVRFLRDRTTALRLRSQLLGKLAEVELSRAAKVVTVASPLRDGFELVITPRSAYRERVVQEVPRVVRQILQLSDLLPGLDAR